MADAITARKASTDGVGGVPGSKKSTATGAEAEVLKESRLETGSPADDETLKEPPPARSQGTYWLMQPVHRKEYVEGIKPKHLAPTRVGPFLHASLACSSCGILTHACLMSKPQI